MIYLWTFLAGFFTCAGIIAAFISWAIKGAEQSFNDDRKYKANDDL